MAYDKIGWHQNDSFPRGICVDVAALHIATYVIWCVRIDLVQASQITSETIQKITMSQSTPTEIFLSWLDGVFTEDVLTERGVRFTDEVYDSGEYLEAYTSIFQEIINREGSIYFVPNTWETADKVQTYLDGRYQQWCVLNT